MFNNQGMEFIVIYNTLKFIYKQKKTKRMRLLREV